MPPSDEATTFALALFDRVYDTEPRQDRVTLAELCQGLTTFILKSDLSEDMTRELRRIDRALAALEAGKRDGSSFGNKLRAAQREGGLESARALAEKLRTNARSRAKTDLRLWSPTLYRAGAKRGNEDVLQVSCVGLDFDSGITIAQAHEAFQAWCHVWHTTWSYSAEYPNKFRLILPLARPLAPASFPAAWAWASARVHHHNDPAIHSVGNTFALPSTPARDAPRAAQIHQAPLLRMSDHVDVIELDPPAITPLEASHFRRSDPRLEYADPILHAPAGIGDPFALFDAPSPLESGAEDADAFDLF